ncbi:MAG TPA: class I SAM-dependent methyltransferase [Polyangiaceae bacterium]|jgi:16S rRNA (cytosine967-C5)-methyltransferase|nr:class I SAM-dependent methyltransferase [Polyangiaceae bacterium]
MPAIVVAFAEAEAQRVRPIALAAFEEARTRRWPFLSDVLEKALRGVPVEDGAVIAAVVHALVKYDRLLGFASGRAEGGARFDALLALMRRPSDVDARLAAIAPRAERLGVTYSMPDALVKLIEEDVGADALEPCLARMNEAPPRVARVNRLKIGREACLEALADEGVTATGTSAARDGIVIGGRASPFRTEVFARGEIEIQDEASQMVAELVAPPPGSTTIDACAGAGGKTLGLAALLGGKGRVVALDVSASKLDELRRRARRAGASNVQALEADLLAPGEALEKLRGTADRVLVDAPCTGLGAIRRNPELRWRIMPDGIPGLVEAQAALLRAASALVAPRGRVVYATCSFLRREGEAVFERFLAEDPRFGSVTARDVLGRARTDRIATANGRYLRTWRFDGTPDGGDAGMDGFFAGVARLVGA